MVVVVVKGGEKVAPTAAGLDSLVLQDGGWMERWMNRGIVFEWFPEEFNRDG